MADPRGAGTMPPRPRPENSVASAARLAAAASHASGHGKTGAPLSSSSSPFTSSTANSSPLSKSASSRLPSLTSSSAPSDSSKAGSSGSSASASSPNPMTTNAGSAAASAAVAAAANGARAVSRRRKSLPPVVREDAASILGGSQARIGMSLILLGIASVVRFGSAEAMSGVLSRFFAAEGLVQFSLAMCLQPTSSLDTPYHILLTLCVVAGLFYKLPIELTQEVGWVLCSIFCVPFGCVLLWQGALNTQLMYHLSPGYWNFSFENRLETPGGSGNASASRTSSVTRVNAGSSNGRFALLHASPMSLTGILAVTQVMVQWLEIGGLSDSDRAILIQARNHFLFRVRNSSSLRHKAIATELLFRVVAGLLMQHTAQQMVEPSGPVSTTIAFMEQQFSERLLQQSEVFMKPLPEPLDPDTALKLVIFSFGGLLFHKRFFKSLKEFQGGSLHPALQAVKYVTRFSILVYLTSRYLIIQSRRNRLQNDHLANRFSDPAARAYFEGRASRIRLDQSGAHSSGASSGSSLTNSTAGTPSSPRGGRQTFTPPSMYL
mmetsp:Transcript_18861/g.37034  ORF Transcript_18861/g.37034 Transcript_18861/m.37034 type:complete len:549 (-) Transcript_18861:45-1691(-)